MAQNKIHRIYNPEDFRRYRDGEMPFSEQHLLERQMMEDPLLAEAYEGFVAMHADDVHFQQSVDELQNRLRTRINEKSKKIIPLWAYSAAASAIIILGAGWLFYTKNQYPVTLKNQGSATSISIEEKKEGKASDAPLTSAVEESVVPKSPSIPDKPGSRVQAIDLNKTDKDSESKLFSGNQENSAIAERSFQTGASPVTVPAQSDASEIVDNETIKGVLVDENGVALAGVTILNSDQTSTQTGEKGEFAINSRRGDSITTAFVGYKSKKIAVGKSDMGVVKLDPDHLALNEVVVIGYGVQKKQSMSAASQAAGYGHPEPVKGWAHYQEYLDKFKDSSSAKGVVKVSFNVDKDGLLFDFKMEGVKELFDQALKVIKAGPEWKPFNSNGLERGKRAQVTVRFGKQ